jgi:ribosomal protein L11 methyltransferase
MTSHDLVSHQNRYPMNKLSFPENLEEIKQQIAEYLADATARVTPRDLGKKLTEDFGMDQKELRSFIRQMLSEGLITYSCDFGRTFIEISYNRPVRIADSVILKPPRLTDTISLPEDIVIELIHGTSFGTGRHPTTRLALMAMEHILRRMDFFEEHEKSAALDIGTGSGVLAIAAVKWGFDHADGTEIDICARKEACNNVQINGLEDKITIHLQDQPSLSKRYALITANLRAPSLKQLYPLIHALSHAKSAIVLSGILSTEITEIISTYTQHDFECIWQSAQKKWAALGFIRR